MGWPTSHRRAPQQPKKNLMPAEQRCSALCRGLITFKKMSGHLVLAGAQEGRRLPEGRRLFVLHLD